MRFNMVGAFVRNAPFGTEIAFAKGLTRLGHEVTAVDPDHPSAFDLTADATIVFKWLEGPCLDAVRLLKGKKIVYQPDDPRFPHIREMLARMRETCDYAFTFDARGAEIARGLGYERAERLLLTADDTLYRRLDGVEKDVDVCFVGSMTGGPNHRSRGKMCRFVRDLFPGLKCEFKSDVYDVEEIVRLYNRSRIVLNHATDVGQPFGRGFGYQCRHFEAGMTGACFLSNSVGERDLKWFFEFDGTEKLALVLEKLADDAATRETFGRNFYDEIRERHLPEHRAAEIVRFVEEVS